MPKRIDHKANIAIINEAIEEYKNGNRTQIEICEEYNIPIKTFSYWYVKSKNNIQFASSLKTPNSGLDKALSKEKKEEKPVIKNIARLQPAHNLAEQIARLQPAHNLAEQIELEYKPRNNKKVKFIQVEKIYNNKTEENIQENIQENISDISEKKEKKLVKINYKDYLSKHKSIV